MSWCGSRILFFYFFNYDQKEQKNLKVTKWPKRAKILEKLSKWPKRAKIVEKEPKFQKRAGILERRAKKA